MKESNWYGRWKATGAGIESRDGSSRFGGRTLSRGVSACALGSLIFGLGAERIMAAMSTSFVPSTSLIDLFCAMRKRRPGRLLWLEVWQSQVLIQIIPKYKARRCSINCIHFNSRIASDRAIERWHSLRNISEITL